jgi:hypothetical protein
VNLAPTLASRGVPGFVPPTPDAETARRLVRDELTDPIYSQEPSLLERALDWLGNQLADLTVDPAAIQPGVAAAVIAGAALVAVLVALYVGGPVRRSRRKRASDGAVLGDDVRTADEIRADADRHAAAGEWDLATLDRFRALLRALEERAVLEDRPGRTAHEAADEAGRAFPDMRTPIGVAAAVFDAVCYGDEPATRADHDQVRELDTALADRTPVRASEGVLTDPAEPADPSDPTEPRATAGTRTSPGRSVP